MRRETAAGFALCGMAMVTVGSIVVAGKFIAAGMPPFTAAALRFAMALPCFALWMALTRTPLPPLPRRHDAALLLTQAALGSVGYTVLTLLGLRFTDAANAGVVAGTLTAVAAALAVLVLRERPGTGQVGAILLATAGVLAVTVADGGAFRLDLKALLGNILMLAAVVCEAVFLLLNKRLHAPLAPLVQSTAMTCLGLFVALPFALLERPWAVPLDKTGLLAVAYYALVPTVLGFQLWYAGASRLTGAEASLATAVLPISAVLLATAVLGEKVGLAQIIGTALVLGAVTLGARGPRNGRCTAAYHASGPPAGGSRQTPTQMTTAPSPSTPSRTGSVCTRLRPRSHASMSGRSMSPMSSPTWSAGSRRYSGAKERAAEPINENPSHQYVTARCRSRAATRVACPPSNPPGA